MDGLDKYKQAWENQPKDSQKISRDAIFKMMHAKSSSIVKWIFIIGLLEFSLLIFSSFFIDYEKSMKIYDEIGLENFILFIHITVFPILIYFLYKFYVNYKSISVIDNTKSLMTKILNTRKTVKRYVFFNLGYLTLILTVVSIATVFHLEKDITVKKLIFVVLTVIAASAIFITLYWLVYQLLYGILLKKLNKNYKELAKLDESN